MNQQAERAPKAQDAPDALRGAQAPQTPHRAPLRLAAWHGGTRARIGVTFALLALLLFTAVGVLSARSARERVAQDTGEALLQLASRMGFALDSDIHERWREIHNVSRFQPLLTGELRPAEWHTLVEQLQRSFSHYAWIGLARPDGSVLAATGGLLEGANVGKRGWFIEASKAPFVGNVHEALLLASKLPPRPDGEPLRLVDVAAPLLSPNGQLLGVLGAHLNLDWAEERRAAVLRTVAPERRVELMVFDSDGQPVLTSALASAVAPSQTSAQAPPQTAAQAAKKRDPLPKTLLDEMVAHAPAVRTWADGQAYLTAAMRYPPSNQHPDLGWTVVARQPQATALAAADSLQQQIWVLGLGGAALFGLTAWWLAGRLTAPLRRVAAQALALTPAALPTTGDAVAASTATGADAPRTLLPRLDAADEVTQLSDALGQLVTQLRQREQELLQLNRTLEDKVAQRTLALEQSNADLRSFSHSVSHDLKGPVGGIGAAVRMVLKRDADSLTDRTVKVLALVATECDRVRALTDEMLTLAMMEQHTLSTVPVDMNALVQTVVADVRAQVEAGVSPGSAATHVELGPLPDVAGDPVLLRQVWHNLIANAFKFSGGRPLPVVRISAQADGAPAPNAANAANAGTAGTAGTAASVTYRVQDNGAGFDPKHTAKLFGMFQRLHKSSDFPGTGIGLSIVKRILTRHGGSIRASSAGPNAADGDTGATFSFTLPVVAAGTQSAHVRGAVAPPVASAAAANPVPHTQSTPLAASSTTSPTTPHTTPLTTPLRDHSAG